MQLLCSCLRPAGTPATCGRAWIWKQPFVAATKHTWSRTNKFIFMSAATGLASSSILDYWQRQPAAHSSTATLSGRRSRTWMLSPEVGFQWQTSCTIHLEGALVVDSLRYNDSSITVEDALWYVAIQIVSTIFQPSCIRKISNYWRASK